jgi:hypothetical protein
LVPTGRWGQPDTLDATPPWRPPPMSPPPQPPRATPRGYNNNAGLLGRQLDLRWGIDSLKLDPLIGGNILRRVGVFGEVSVKRTLLRGL